MRILTLLLFALLSIDATIAQEPTALRPAPLLPQVAASDATPADGLRKTHVYRLKNASVHEVAKALDRELAEMLDDKPKNDGFIVDSPVVLIPEAVTNTLLVSARPSCLDQIAEMIYKLDRAPTQIAIQVIVQDIEDGKATIVSRPQVMTLDGCEAVVQFGAAEKSMRITMTPHVVRPNQETAHPFDDRPADSEDARPESHHSSRSKRPLYVAELPPAFNKSSAARNRESLRLELDHLERQLAILKRKLENDDPTVAERASKIVDEEQAPAGTRYP